MPGQIVDDQPPLGTVAEAQRQRDGGGGAPACRCARVKRTSSARRPLVGRRTDSDAAACAGRAIPSQAR